MINITCNNNWVHKKISDLLYQKGLYIIDNENKNFFLNINIDDREDSVLLISREKSYKFIKPIDFMEIYSKIILIILDVEFNFNHLTYFPFRNLILNEKNKINLGEKHNLIFSYLLINQQAGISKFNLYKKIWPEDVDMQINKLDTHLTNLKKFLKTELDYDLNVKSQKNILKLTIN